VEGSYGVESGSDFAVEIFVPSIRLRVLVGAPIPAWRNQACTHSVTSRAALILLAGTALAPFVFSSISVYFGSRRRVEGLTCVRVDVGGDCGDWEFEFCCRCVADECVWVLVPSCET